MKNNLLKIAGIVICAVALGLNLQNAFSGYGVKKGNIHPEVLAQTNTNGGTTSGGGSTSGGGTTGGGTSGGSTIGGGTTDRQWESFKPDPNKNGWQNFWARVGSFFNNVWDQIVDFFVDFFCTGWKAEPILDEAGNNVGVRFIKEFP